MARITNGVQTYTLNRELTIGIERQEPWRSTERYLLDLNSDNLVALDDEARYQ